MIVAIATVGATVGVERPRADDPRRRSAEHGDARRRAGRHPAGGRDRHRRRRRPRGDPAGPLAGPRLGGGHVITFDGGRQALRRAGRRRPPLARDQVGRDRDPRRPVGVRQDHLAQDDQPAHRADRGDDLHRRSRHPHLRRQRPAPLDRVRHPAGRAVPALHGRRERRDGAAPARAGRSSGSRRGSRSCSTSSACRRRTTRAGCRRS